MKKMLCGTLAIVVIAASAAWADDKSCPMPTVKNSAELEQVAALAGTWTGTAKHGDGKEEPATVTYRVTSGGSAVAETLSPGTPHEMISMYHDRGGKLAMTHYCMLGNQPELVLHESATGRLDLEASAQTRSALAGQMYMSSLVIEQPAADQLVETWSAVDANGKPTDSTILVLKKTSGGQP